MRERNLPASPSSKIGGSVTGRGWADAGTAETPDAQETGKRSPRPWPARGLAPQPHTPSRRMVVVTGAAVNELSNARRTWGCEDTGTLGSRGRPSRAGGVHRLCCMHVPAMEPAGPARGSP